MRATLDRRVRDIMHYGVITVSENTNVSDMCRIMSDNRVSCVAVADHTREVVGVVSSTDIIATGISHIREGHVSRAKVLMTTPIIAVRPPAM